MRHKWKGPPGEGRADPEQVQAAKLNDPGFTPLAVDLQELTALWWRLACQGLRLPAECGVILLVGAGR